MGSDGHAAGGQGIDELGEANEQKAQKRAAYSAERGDEEDARLRMFVREIVAVERLRRTTTICRSSMPSEPPESFRELTARCAASGSE